jgi:FixJ family two-component response regulator
MTSTEPTVFIIDDDPSARRGLARLIRTAELSVESFASAEEFLNSDLRGGPGCIVLDVRMKGMSGPQLQEELKKTGSGLPIVFLSGHGDVPTTARAMKKGAVDFLTKPVDAEELLAAVRASLAMDAENRMEHEEIRSFRERIKTLTRREYEAMTFVISGILNKQIADEMEISVDTVKIHRGRVMKKMGVASVAELVRQCEKAGVEPAPVNPE